MDNPASSLISHNLANGNADVSGTGTGVSNDRSFLGADANGHSPADTPAEAASVSATPLSNPTPFLRDASLRIEQINEFAASTRTGSGIRGRVLRVSRHFVVTEIIDPSQLLAPGWQTPSARVVLAQDAVYDGPAVLAKVIDTGRSLVCEWTLQGEWSGAPNFPNVYRPAGDAEPSIRAVYDRLRILTRISQVFKAVISDVTGVIEEIKHCLDRLEAREPFTPEPGMPPQQDPRLLQLRESVFPALNEVFSRFEAAAAEVPPELDAEHHSLIRRQLHPLMLCSPFIHRIYSKPLGYAGDYGMLNMLISNPYEGHSLFAKLLNGWLVQSAAGEAYRNRVSVLEQQLAQQSLRCHLEGRGMRVMSIGCGAANEVARFIATNDLADRAEFNLIDFNEPTLAAARENVEQAMREHWRMCRVDYVQKSIQQLIRESGKYKSIAENGAGAGNGDVQPWQRYDFVYCTGLFDYFSARVCGRLVECMYRQLAPGGKMLVCNFTPSNPIRYFMKYILDWDLIHRTENDLISMLPSGELRPHCLIEHSPGKVEAYLHLTIGH